MNDQLKYKSSSNIRQNLDNSWLLSALAGTGSNILLPVGRVRQVAVGYRDINTAK